MTHPHATSALKVKGETAKGYTLSLFLSAVCTLVTLTAMTFKGKAFYGKGRLIDAM